MPQVAPNQYRLPAAGGMPACKKHFFRSLFNSDADRKPDHTISETAIKVSRWLKRGKHSKRATTILETPRLRFSGQSCVHRHPNQCGAAADQWAPRNYFAFPNPFIVSTTQLSDCFLSWIDTIAGLASLACPLESL